MIVTVVTLSLTLTDIGSILGIIAAIMTIKSFTKKKSSHK
jgi:hypothetical protein